MHVLTADDFAADTPSTTSMSAATWRGVCWSECARADLACLSVGLSDDTPLTVSLAISSGPRDTRRGSACATSITKAVRRGRRRRAPKSSAASSRRCARRDVASVSLVQPVAVALLEAYPLTTQMPLRAQPTIQYMPSLRRTRSRRSSGRQTADLTTRR